MEWIKKGELYEVVAPLVHSLGYEVLELTGAQRKGTLHVNLVILGRQGTTMDDCAKTYRVAYPRLEVWTSATDVHLEVSSPGVERKIKHADEFSLFVGMKARMLSDDAPDWIVGIIDSVTGDSVHLETEANGVSMRFDQIRKAELVYSDHDIRTER